MMILIESNLAPRFPQRLRQSLPLLVVYVLVTMFTVPHYMGDTTGYGNSVASFAQHRTWEFGHLLWFPFGWIVFKILTPVTTLFVGASPRLNATLALIIINWAAGLWCVYTLQGLVRRIAPREWIVGVVGVAFIVTNGFSDYTQTGCAYVPGLACLLFSLYVIACDANDGRGQWHTGIVAGVWFAVAVCLWLPYILAAPAVLVAPVLLTRADARMRWRTMSAIVVACGVAGFAAYFIAALTMGIQDVAAARAWIDAADHGATSSGLPRAVFGFARSFINMHSDGVIFKRFMLGDPYNSVSIAELLRVSIFKLALFYTFLVAIIGGLVLERRWRVLLFLGVNAAPILSFAVYWQGGDMERYMALYPAVFIAFGASLMNLTSARARLYTSGAALLFVLVMAFVNLAHIALPVSRARQQRTVERVGALLDERRAEDLIFVVGIQDEVYSFVNTYPFHPAVRVRDTRVTEAVGVNMEWGGHWRETFAGNVLGTWQRGGRVWVSQRALNERPAPELEWVEGADPRIKWSDVPAFFGQFEWERGVGGDDGFLLLAAAPRNEQALRLIQGER